MALKHIYIYRLHEKVILILIKYQRSSIEIPAALIMWLMIIISSDT